RLRGASNSLGPCNRVARTDLAATSCKASQRQTGVAWGLGATFSRRAMRILPALDGARGDTTSSSRPDDRARFRSDRVKSLQIARLPRHRPCILGQERRPWIPEDLYDVRRSMTDVISHRPPN